MIMSVTSSKSLDALDQDLRKAVQRHKFGVLNVLDLKQTLGNKGIVIEKRGANTGVIAELVRGGSAGTGWSRNAGFPSAAINA